VERIGIHRRHDRRLVTRLLNDVEPFTVVAGTDGRVIGTRKRDLLELEPRVDDY
jgi:hypothetical protein